MNNRGNILTNNPLDIITPYRFLISEFKVVLHYIFMFFLPQSMCVEYDWKLSPSFFSPDSFFPFLSLCFLSYLLYRCLQDELLAPIAFGGIWFLVCVAPRSSIIPSPELICDYKTYIASPGILFVIALGCVYAAVKLYELILTIIPSMSAYSSLVSSFAFFSLCLLAGKSSMQRNIVWSSPVEFWTDIVSKAPGKARAHNNLGVALSEEGKFDEAIPCYLQAIKLDSFYSDPWSNLAVAHSIKGNDDKAIEALGEAIRIFPQYAEAHNNLGTLFIKKKEYERAEQMLDRAIELRPWYGKAWFNKGRLYYEQQNVEQAYHCFSKAAREGDLDNAEGFAALGQLCMQMQKFDEAIDCFETIRKGGVFNPQIDFNLANAYFLGGRHDLAKTLYQQLAQTNSQDVRIFYNLAEVCFIRKEYEEAERIFSAISKQFPQFFQARLRQAKCFEELCLKEKAYECLHHLCMTQTLAEDQRSIIVAEMERMKEGASPDEVNATQQIGTLFVSNA